MIPVLPIAVVLAAAAVSWSACGALRSRALASGIVSRGHGARAGPGGVPLLGGLGALAGLAGGLAAGWLVGPGVGGSALALRGVPVGPALGWVGLVAGYALLGLRDDVAGLSPGVRLGLETAWAAVALGLPVLLSPRFPAGTPAGPGAGLWTGGVVAAVVAGANAFNLTDNADGLAAGTGLLSLAGCAVLLAPVPGGAWAGAVGLAGAGALGGFLIWNRPPARLYLGDAGALAFGALLAALLVTPLRSAVGGGPWLAILFVAGYFLVDPTYAVLGRLRRGAAPWHGGVDHLSHDLEASLGGWPRAWRLVLAVQGFSVLSGLGVLRGILPIWALPAAACPWAGLWLAGARGRRARSARRK
jgi:UDP-GlcNAc:undecaprenyl-phosphate GlcNAc-1-phosphate transferase